MTPMVDSFIENGPSHTFKDPRWLKVEICREFQRGKCTRSDAECRFAHPDESVQVENGSKVTACFDSMKDRCQRESCKYFHPPHHIKLQLEANGRLLKQHKQRLLQSFVAQQQMIQTPANIVPFPVNTLATSEVNSTLAPPGISMFGTPGVSTLGTPEMGTFGTPGVSTLGTPGMGTFGTPGVSTLAPPGVSTFPRTFVSTPVDTLTTSMPPITTNSNRRSEKVLPFLEVCQDYIKGTCFLTECSAAHPDMDLLRDRDQRRITVCMDYVKGRCTRESCRYFHPPAHLQGKLRSVKITQSLISTSSRKRVGEPKDDLEEQSKQQALNYTLINTPLTLPTNFTTFIQPSAFQQAANSMQFAPAFFSTVPLSVPQFTTTTATSPYVYPQMQPQDYNYVVTDRGIFYGCQSVPAYYQNGYHYVTPYEQQLSALSNHNNKHIQLPICRDYKSGSCRRDSCRYVHLDNRNVEVIDGKVTICIDATKGKCQRTECKYYHHTSASDKNDGASHDKYIL